MKIDIGIMIDLVKLISTRLLIQASSGGGKSYAIRKLCESIGTHVQVIIVDIEGEFVTLREKLPFALVSKEGEIPLNVRYAETLAHKLLETNLSAIIDLSEMDVYQRRVFGKRFFQALIESPKSLWHPCIVVIDEADFFAPEGKESESTQAVINLSSRGRKRGICSVLATQRIAKLNKDATAELVNKIIGLTAQDIDQKRAGNELGFVNRDDILGLRKLKPGEFYGFGPAISNEVVKFKVGKARTTHMEAGQYKRIAPPTPNAIKKIIGKLESIPQEAEKELNTKKELDAEIKRLRGELAKVKHLPASSNNAADSTMLKVIKSNLVELQLERDELFNDNEKLLAGMKHVGVKGFELTSIADQYLKRKKKPLRKHKNIDQWRPIQKQKSDVQTPENNKSGNGLLKKSASTFLKALCMYYPKSISRQRLSLITGYKISSSNFGNTLTELRAVGYMKDGPNKEVAATDKGYYEVGDFESLPTNPDTLKQYWANKVSKSACKFFLYLYDRGPDTWVTREAISLATEYNMTSSNFGNTLTELRTLGLILDGPNKCVKINPDLFNN